MSFVVVQTCSKVKKRGALSMAHGDDRGPKNTLKMDAPRMEGEPTPVDPLPPNFGREAHPPKVVIAQPSPAPDPPKVVVAQPPAAPNAPKVAVAQKPAVPIAAIESAKVVISPTVGNALRPGQIVGRYRVKEGIGSGGFGEVYEAVDIHTGDVRALKLLNVAEACRAASIARFKTECDTLMALRQVEGVVHVYDSFKINNETTQVLVMHRLTGMTLRAALESDLLTLLDKLWIAIRVARTTAALHRHHVIHRDLKPENIFLELAPGAADGMEDRFRPVILDLGCAKTPEGPTTSTESAAMTWQYASPEQLGRGPLTNRSDIFAFGCILYEMLEGEKPLDYHERVAGATPLEYRMVWPIAISPKLPTKMGVVFWNDVVAICLEKDPDDRFQTMTAAEVELVRLVEHIKARRIPRDDFLAASLAGARARTPPRPLPAIPEAGRTVDVTPHEVSLDAKIPSPSFLVIEGPPALLTRRFAIGRSLTVGRRMPKDPLTGTADLTFPHDTLSTLHCKLEAALEEVSKSVYLVQDLRSTNGTQLAGNPIGEGLLRPGQTLRLGGELVLQLYGPGTLSEHDALAATLPAPIPALGPGGRPRTRPITPLREGALESGSKPDVDSAIETALVVEREKASRRVNLLMLAVVILAVAMLAILLQVFHVLPSWLGGTK